MKVAVLATDAFEWSELTKPVNALEKIDITVHVISPKSGKKRVRSASIMSLPGKNELSIRKIRSN